MNSSFSINFELVLVLPANPSFSEVRLAGPQTLTSAVHRAGGCSPPRFLLSTFAVIMLCLSTSLNIFASPWRAFFFLGGLLLGLRLWLFSLHWLFLLLPIASPRVVMKTIRRAAESRLLPSSRPPPEPDSVHRRRLVWLIVGCIVSSMPPAHAFPVPHFSETMNPDPTSPLFSVDESKPTIADLESMLAKADLPADAGADLHPSSRAPSRSGTTDSAVFGDPASLAQVVAAAVASALRATHGGHPAYVGPPASSPPSTSPRNHVTTIADMELRKSPCSSAEMDLGRIQVARTARGRRGSPQDSGPFLCGD